MARILILDDDPGVAEALSLLFVALGHEVREASTVASARRLLGESESDLVVADEQLVDGRGSAFLRWAAERSNAQRILLTGGAGPEPRALPAGTLVRRKPWDIVEAEAAVTELLAKR